MAITPHTAVRKYLQGLVAITALVGVRVYEGGLPDTRDFIIGGVKGNAPVKTPPKTILIMSSGGPSNLESPIIFPDLNFYCYGENLGRAWDVNNGVRDALHAKTNLDILPAPNRIIVANNTVFGQEFTEQATKWSRVLSTYSFEMTNV